MSSIKPSDRPKRRPRRLRTPIEPIHVDELLAGAGMSGYLGVLNAPVLTNHLEKRPTPSKISSRVASVVLKMEALTVLMDTKGGENAK